MTILHGSTFSTKICGGSLGLAQNQVQGEGMEKRFLKSRDNQLAKRPVAFQVPLPAHGLGAGLIALGIQQAPHPTPGGLRPRASVMGGQAAFQIRRPTDIGAQGPLAGTPQNVDKTRHKGRFSALLWRLRLEGGRAISAPDYRTFLAR